MTCFAYAARGRALISCLAAALCCALLAGCSNIEDFAVTPGKYEIYSCDQIATQGKATANRERELKQLMDKASQGSGGAIVNAMAYRSEYLTAQGQLKQLEERALEKHCDMPWRSSSDRATW